MTPLPENNTDRLWVRYTSAGRPHELLFRFDTGTGASTAAASANVAILVLKTMIASNDAVTGARFSAGGSLVSFPVPVTTGAGSGSAWTDADTGANFYSATGRSTDGRDVKYTVFTTLSNPDTLGYRYNSPTGQWLDFLEVLDEMPTNPVTISGLIPIMNSYVNWGYNAYWQRKIRRGG